MIEDYIREANLIRAVDGDTVDLEVEYGYGKRGDHRFRLKGIDTPERGQEGYAEATAHLASLLTDERIIIQSYKYQKDGFRRYIVDIWTTSGHVNQQMIDDGFAKEYVR